MSQEETWDPETGSDRHWIKNECPKHKAQCILPLDNMSQKAIDLAGLVALFPELETTLAYVRDEVAFKALFQGEGVRETSPVPRKARNSGLTPTDVTMLDNQVTQRVLMQDVKCMMVAFKTPKANKRVSRLLINAVPLNERQCRPPHFRMPYFETIRNRILCREWAVQLDLRNYFYEIPMTGGICEYFCFRVARGPVRMMKRLPQGWKFAPFIAQRIAEAVCSVVQDGVDPVCLIDDWLLLGDDKAQAECAGDAVRAVCKRVHAEVHEDKSSQEALRIVTYAGVEWDMAEKRHRLGAKFIAKWSRWFVRIQTIDEMPLSNWISIASVVMYSLRVRLTPTAGWRPIYKWVSHASSRVQSGDWTWERVVQPWADSLELMRGYESTLRDNAWVMFHTSVSLHVDLWSDASLDGWAFLLAHDETVLGGLWGNVRFDERIDIIELRTAVYQIARVVEAATKNYVIVVWCDNVVACAAMRRMRGWSWSSNQVLLPLGDLLLTKKCSLDVRWVATAHMLADPWTRLRLPEGVQSKQIGPKRYGDLLRDLDQVIVVLS